MAAISSLPLLQPAQSSINSLLIMMQLASPSPIEAPTIDAMASLPTPSPPPVVAATPVLLMLEAAALVMQSAPSQYDHHHEKAEILPCLATMEMTTMNIEAEIIVAVSFSLPPAIMGKVNMEKGLQQGGA
jgi:hypothetical protein